VNVPSWIQPRSDGVVLAVRLQPHASKDSIGGVLGNELKITVTAPPVDSAANEALVRLLAEKLDCPRGAVRLIRGQTSRHKQVLVVGMSLEQIIAKLPT
jgi:uncharacterized protein (TIGR00251 family)